MPERIRPWFGATAGGCASFPPVRFCSVGFACDIHVILCEIESGYFRPNIEADESAYFGLEELPILAKEKNNEEQIKMCFSAYYDRNWQVLFD